jgi:hypothetical protein
MGDMLRAARGKLQARNGKSSRGGFTHGLHARRAREGLPLFLDRRYSRLRFTPITPAIESNE